MIVFGPVPSRRLGQSLGINNIPPKTCPYSCVYCQLGRTNRMQIERREFYKPEDIFSQTAKKMEELKAKGESTDYITFVADGEPTLDNNLGAEITLLKQFGIKIAVITNASLLWIDEVKEDLMKADWVSLKIDAADNDTWHRIDRPHGHLDIDRIMTEELDFARNFKGTLVTETMLVSGYNDGIESINKIADHIKKIKPSRAYLLVPTRPPAESVVQRPSTQSLKTAFKIIYESAHVDVECVTGDEGERFFFTDDMINDFLSIISVHPVKEDVIYKLLKERNISKEIISDLIDKELVEEFIYENKKFFVKKLR
jgi:wyosine [tRNA(Phe)-imidazoG37] synthetase (radical SAM superfamily)